MIDYFERLEVAPPFLPASEAFFESVEKVLEPLLPVELEDFEGVELLVVAMETNS